MSGSHRRLTGHDRNRMLELHKKGLGYTAIAKRFDVPPHTVKTTIQSLEKAKEQETHNRKAASLKWTSMERKRQEMLKATRRRLFGYS